MNQDRDGELDLAMAAKRLGMSWHRAYRLVLMGTLRGTRRKGRWWVSEADVSLLVAKERQPNRDAQ